jgi:hypothetical protein
MGALLSALGARKADGADEAADAVVAVLVTSLVLRQVADSSAETRDAVRRFVRTAGEHFPEELRSCRPREGAEALDC